MGKAYKWGYFPPTQKYDDVDLLIKKKKPSSILWVGRLLQLKHPENAVYVAKKLKETGFKFELNIIGDGELRGPIQKMIGQCNLEDCVHMLGAMSPEQVRKYMEESEIFLFTSDRNEGWGAVLNESMNSACAVAASHAIGSVPFLLKNGENGLVYRDGDLEDLFQKVKYLLDHPKQRADFGRKAYLTVIDQWNAENAAKRLLSLSKMILDGEKHPEPYKDGICSKA